MLLSAGEERVTVEVGTVTVEVSTEQKKKIKTYSCYLNIERFVIETWSLFFLLLLFFKVYSSVKVKPPEISNLANIYESTMKHDFISRLRSSFSYIKRRLCLRASITPLSRIITSGRKSACPGDEKRDKLQGP